MQKKEYTPAQIHKQVERLLKADRFHERQRVVIAQRIAGFQNICKHVTVINDALCADCGKEMHPKPVKLGRKSKPSLHDVSELALGIEPVEGTLAK